MALVYADRVLEESTTTGTGDITLAGSPSAKYQPFSAVMAASDTCYIVINHATLDEVEVCLATFTAGGALQRGAISFSSNSNNPVNFSAGTKNVYLVDAAVGILTHVNVSAGTTSNNLTALTFGNGGGITFGLDGSTVTAAAPAGVPSPVNFSAGTTSSDLGSVVFSNAGNVSFGLNGATITATATVATSLSNIRVSAGTTSNLLSAVTFSNSNNVSFGLNGSVVTATVTVATSLSNVNLSAGTTSQNLSAFVFSNSNNVSFGLNGSTVTASATVATSLSNVNLSAGTTSQNLSAFVFSNSNNVSFGLNGSTVTATITVPAQTNQTVGLYMSSNTTSSVSSGTVDARSLTFRGMGVASVGYSGGEVVVSVPAGGGGLTNINVSAGTTSQNLSALTFSNGSGVSFGLNGSVVTASVAGGGGRTLSAYAPYPYKDLMTGSVTGSIEGSGTYFNRVVLPTDVAVSNLNLILSFNVGPPTATSAASTGTARYSYANTVYVFTRQDFGANYTNISPLTSGTFGLTAGISYSSTSQSFIMSWVTDSTGGTTSTNTTTGGSNWSSVFTGRRIVAVPLVTTLTAGEYFFAFANSSTTGTTQQNTTLLSVSHFGLLGQASTLTVRALGNNGSFNARGFEGYGHGRATAITTNATMGMTNISYQGGVASNSIIYFNLSNASVVS